MRWQKPKTEPKHRHAAGSRLIPLVHHLSVDLILLAGADVLGYHQR